MKNKEMKKDENKEIIKNTSEKKDIEVIIGDGSSLEISSVNDCMNSLRPNTLGQKKKTVIIPTEKKNIKTNKTNDSNIEEPTNNDSTNNE